MSVWSDIKSFFNRKKEPQETPGAAGVEIPTDQGVVTSGRGAAIGTGETEYQVTDGITTNPFMHDLGDVTWQAQREAQVIGSQSLDPAYWQDGQIAFEFERALGHQHEEIRHRLATWVENKVSEPVEKLTELASRGAEASDEMKECDREAVIAFKEWRRVYEEVQRDETELARFHHIRKGWSVYKTYKYLAWGVFVASESAITYMIFMHLVGEAPIEKAIALFLALGVILAMVLVPHYAAVAIREGFTRKHKYQVEAYERRDLVPSSQMHRKADHEDVEDRGSRWVGAMICLVLLAAIVPLSFVRASDFKIGRVEKAEQAVTDAQAAVAEAEQVIDNDKNAIETYNGHVKNPNDAREYVPNATHTSNLISAQGDLRAAESELSQAKKQNPWVWVTFFLLFQLLISLYFFLREWSDHGGSAIQLRNLQTLKEESLKKRRKQHALLCKIVGEYYAEAEKIIVLLRQSIHWDHEIVSSYYKTIYYMRHIVTDLNPELQQFVHSASVPAMQSAELSESVGSTFHTEPISWDNALLQRDDLTGSRGWITEALAALSGTPSQAIPQDAVNPKHRWLTQRDVVAFIEYLFNHFGHELEYQRPEVLDDADYVDVEDLLDALHEQQFEDLFNVGSGTGSKDSSDETGDHSSSGTSGSEDPLSPADLAFDGLSNEAVFPDLNGDPVAENPNQPIDFPSAFSGSDPSQGDGR